MDDPGSGGGVHRFEGAAVSRLHRDVDGDQQQLLESVSLLAVECAFSANQQGIAVESGALLIFKEPN